MTRCTRPAGDAGFTLLEIIVAAVVLGFVVAGLSQATRFGINAWDVQTRLANNAADMERLDRILRLLIEQSAPPMSADDKPFAGQEHRAEFACPDLETKGMVFLGRCSNEGSGDVTRVGERTDMKEEPQPSIKRPKRLTGRRDAMEKQE